MPGPPLGPSYWMTTTSPGWTLLARMDSTASSWDSTTNARPTKWKRDSSMPADLMIAPFAAMLP